MSSENPASKPTGARQTLDGLIRRSKSMERRVIPVVKPGFTSRPVVAVKGLTSNAKAEDLSEGKLLSGDIVDGVNVGGVSLTAPFAGGKTGLQRELRRLYNTGDTMVDVTVRRGKGKSASVQASIVPDESVMLKKQYVLRATNDANHIVTFMDTTEEECLALQELRCARLVTQLANTQLKDVYMPYQWEEKMHQLLPIQRSSMVFSLLVVPFVPDRSMPSYHDLEDTVARAMAWLYAAQASGVPINFLNIQTEPLLTKVSGQQASSCTVSREDLSSIINTGIYGFEDYHGIDIGVVRAVRLWYVPTVAEIAIVIKPEEGETRLGVIISRTDEGFCYVSSVEDGTVADRAGLKTIFVAACTSGRKLVISRIGDLKLTPSMVSSSGSIRCFDTMSISQKLSIHRQAGQPVRMHLIVWDGTVLARGWGGSANADCNKTESKRERYFSSAAAVATTNHNSTSNAHTGRESQHDAFGRLSVDLSEQPGTPSYDNSYHFESNGLELVVSDSERGKMERDSGGEFSFRLSNFDISTGPFDKF